MIPTTHGELPQNPETYATLLKRKFPGIRFATARPDFGTWEKEYHGQNYRNVLPCEIVFDIEDTINYPKLETVLEAENYYFSTWTTGGKGTHTHLFFNHDLSIEAKKHFQKHYAEKAGIPYDPVASQANGKGRLIGLEWSDHRKTGNTKRLISEHKGLEYNNYPTFLGKPTKKNEYPIHKTFSKNHINPINCFALEYAAENRFPEGERHPYLAKNFAIYTFNHPRKEQLRKAFCETQGMPESELSGWDRYIRSGKYQRVYCRELLDYFERNGKKDIVLLCRSSRRCFK